MNDLHMELKQALEGAQTGAPEASVDTAIAVYHRAKAEMDRFKAVCDEARQLVEDIMAETGQTVYKTAAGVASITSAYVSVSFDAKALDALMASSDELRRILEPHRKESHRAGGLRITSRK